jgi:phosphoglycolate phosphatase-like HAD superfamily hydrolase
VFALEDACRDVTGHALDLQAIRSDGLTDHQLAVKILEQAGAPPSTDLVERFLRRYEAHLPTRLPQRQGRVLDNVREILAHLAHARPDVHSRLLTGNTEAGARAKLTHYGLQPFFEGGSFSEDTGPRTDIAVRAIARLRSTWPGVVIDPHRIVVVGDTPHDINCANAIGARALAVASGVFTREALIAHGAWVAVDRLPGPAEFEALIDRHTGAPTA